MSSHIASLATLVAIVTAAICVSWAAFAVVVWWPS